jgi:hypothetical protein
MTKFLYLFRGGDAARTQQSPEEMQAHMEIWKNWMGSLAGSGQLVDGLPLGKDGKVVKAGATITDGPFAEGNEIVGGYLIVNAADLGAAVEISKGCPIFEHNGTVEVREIMSMDM